MDIHHDFSTALKCSLRLLLAFCTKYDLDWEANLNIFLAQQNQQLSSSAGCHKLSAVPEVAQVPIRQMHLAHVQQRECWCVNMCLSTIFRCSQLPRPACRSGKKWMHVQTQEWSDQKPSSTEWVWFFRYILLYKVSQRSGIHIFIITNVCKCYLCHQ